MGHFVCLDCKYDMGPYTEATAKKTQCDNCGSSNVTYLIELKDKITFHEGLKGKSEKIPGKKKPRIEFQIGEEWSVEREKFVNKKRLIDREHDAYHERVADPDTGEIIHECDEPLSEHFGHGSAKFAKKVLPDTGISKES